LHRVCQTLALMRRVWGYSLRRAGSETKPRISLPVWLEQRPLLTAVGFGFFLWVALLLLAQMLAVLVLILVAIILATVLSPVVHFMRRARVPRLGWRMPKWAAVLVIYLVIVAALAGVGYRVALAVARELSNLLSTFPQAFSSFLLQIDQLEQASGLFGVLPSGQALIREVEAYAAGVVSSPGLLSQFVSNITWIVFGVFFVAVLALFMVQESDALLEFWVCLWPPHERDRVRATTADVGDRIGYWVLGQLTVAIISGLLAGLGVFALDLPYPFLFGAATTLLDLAPMVGPGIMAVPAGLVALSQGPVKVAMAVLLFYGIAFLDGHVFSPFITGRFVRLKLSLVIAVVPLGFELYGVLGALLAIPITAAISVVFVQVLLPLLRRHQGAQAQTGRQQERDRHDHAA